jgi:hypothetical protein
MFLCNVGRTLFIKFRLILVFRPYYGSGGQSPASHLGGIGSVPGQSVPDCLLNHVTEGKMEERTEVTGRRERRRKQLLDFIKETRHHWKLKEEALDRTLWRTGFGRGYGPVVRQTTERSNVFVTSAELSRLPVKLYQRPLWPEDRSLSIHGSVQGWHVFNLSSSPLTSHLQRRRLRQLHVALNMKLLYGHCQADLCSSLAPGFDRVNKGTAVSKARN